MWNRRQPRQWNTWAKRANAKCRKWKPRAKNVQGTQTMSRTPSQSRRTRTNLWLRYNSLLKLRISNALISSRNEIEMPDQRKYSHWHTLTHTHTHSRSKRELALQWTWHRRWWRRQQPTSNSCIVPGHFQPVSSVANLSFYWWVCLRFASTWSGPLCEALSHMCSMRKSQMACSPMASQRGGIYVN